MVTLTLSNRGPSGYSPPVEIEGLHSLGDLNGDGYGDLLLVLASDHEPYKGVALIDGHLLELKWLKYLPTEIIARSGLIDKTGQAWEDTDGDGWGDVLLAIGADYPTREWTAYRLSGESGVTLWESTARSGYTNHPSRIGDINLDGVADLFFHSDTHGVHLEGDVWVMSGLDGSLIWRRALADYDKHYSPNVPIHGSGPWGQGHPAPDINNDGWPELLSSSSDGGLHLGDWNTHLGDSLLLGASLQSLSLGGTLTAGGKATHRIRMPLGAGLAGKTLHAIAVVEDATRPGGVWCKSTVASVEIQP